ncbi:MAG: hypothetical protein NTX79_01420 [Candidatus Micrarchaeota archaeon]|nr:hypothetical protein [Candidatus Micrarchaeota archaeon]
MSRFALPLLSLVLVLLLFGCAQGGIPSACAGSPGDKLPNCVYVAAVLGQNPYDCYSLKDISQREKCLRDASDSAVKKLLEQMAPAERAKVFAAIPGADGASDISSQIPIPPANEPASPDATPAIINPPAGVSAADSQAYVRAIAATDMAPCTTINDASTRASCITQVALRVKNPAVCGQLTLKADIDLCNLYAKAGEQAK